MPLYGYTCWCPLCPSETAILSTSTLVPKIFSINTERFRIPRNHKCVGLNFPVQDQPEWKVSTRFHLCECFPDISQVPFRAGWGCPAEYVVPIRRSSLASGSQDHRPSSNVRYPSPRPRYHHSPELSQEPPQERLQERLQEHRSVKREDILEDSSHDSSVGGYRSASPKRVCGTFDLDTRDCPF